MAQTFLLKTDVAIASTITSSKPMKSQAPASDDKAVESFSSALDKQSIQQDKKTNKSDHDDKTVNSADKEENKAEISGEKDGKILPKDDNVVAKTEKTDGEDEVKVNDEITGIKTESTDDRALTASLNAVTKLQDPNALTSQEQEQEKASDIKKTAGENSKLPLADNFKLTGDILQANKIDVKLTVQQAETPEKKQSLRSDILNALLKKPNAEGEKLASAVDQKIAENASLMPISKDGLTEEQKIIALANNLKLKGTLSTNSTLERNASISTTQALSTAVSSLTSSNAVSSTAVSAQPTLNLQPALQSEAWSRVLSSRVIWMAREGVQQASLKLNPANMGPVEVKLHMHNDQASISFIAQHAATRDALEQALPRLRESFQENGMELAHADVSQENFSQADAQDNNKTTNNGLASERDNVDVNSESTIHDINVSEHDIAMGLSVFA